MQARDFLAATLSAYGTALHRTAHVSPVQFSSEAPPGSCLRFVFRALLPLIRCLVFFTVVYVFSAPIPSGYFGVDNEYQEAFFSVHEARCHRRQDTPPGPSARYMYRMCRHESLILPNACFYYCNVTTPANPLLENTRARVLCSLVLVSHFSFSSILSSCCHQRRGTIPVRRGAPVLHNRRRPLPLHRDLIWVFLEE